MSAEKYLIASFSRRGLLPLGHTLSDMADEAAGFLSMPAGLKDELSILDGLEFLCPFAPVDRDRSTEADRDAYLSTLSALSSIVADDLSDEAPQDEE